MDTSVEDVIDGLGFGRFNIKLCLILGLFLMVDGIEITLISLIAPKLQCEWKLSAFETALMSSGVFFGLGIGSVYFGWLGDKYGRKIIMIASSLVALYFGVLTSTADNFVWFLLLRIFVGIGIGGGSCGICYIAEFSGTTHRGRIIIGSEICFAIGSVYVAAIAYFLMTTLGWRMVVVFSIIPLPFIIILLPWLPESMRYLQNTGNMDAIMKLLHLMSKENKIPLPKHLNIECEVSKECGNYSILLRRQYFTKVVIMSVLWIIGEWAYYSAVFINPLVLENGIYDPHYTKPITTSTDTCHTLTEEDYLQNIIVCFGELPGIILAMIVVEKLGRKKCLAFTYFATSVCFLCLALPLTPTSSTIISFILRALVACIPQFLILYNIELFPTTIRTTALGLCNAIGRWFTTLTPFVVTMLVNSSYMTLIIILSSLTLICSVLSCLLPETTGLYLTNR